MERREPPKNSRACSHSHLASCTAECSGCRVDGKVLARMAVVTGEGAKVVREQGGEK